MAEDGASRFTVYCPHATCEYGDTIWVGDGCGINDLLKISSVKLSRNEDDDHLTNL